MAALAKPPAGSALSLLRSPRNAAATPSRDAPGAARASPSAAAAAAARASVPPLTLQLAVATQRAPQPPPPPAGPPPRLYCSFNVGMQCKHALATRECRDCKRWDRTGTGYHCEACFAARHPWTAVAHTWRALHQRAPTPPRRAALNPVAERTVAEAAALLRRTEASGAALGAPLGAQAPALASAAGKCDELVGRLTTMLLQLRDPAWQARQHAAKRIILCWRGRVWRAWFRTATALLWGKMRDPASGDDFYVNMATKATLWAAPVVFGRQLAPAAVRRVFPCSLSKQAAAVVIQRSFRGHASRRRTARVFVRAWRMIRVSAAAPQRAAPRPRDPAAPYPPPHYYFNVLPEGDRLWRPPTAERPRVLHQLHPVEFGAHPDDQPSVGLARVLQKLGRRFTVRMAFFKQAAAAYERVWDADYKRYYYFNRHTGGTGWVKPMASLLRGYEFPIMAGEAAPGETEANAMGARAHLTSSGMWRVTEEAADGAAEGAAAAAAAAAAASEGEEGTEADAGVGAKGAGGGAAPAKRTPRKALFSSSVKGGGGGGGGGGGDAKLHKVVL